MALDTFQMFADDSHNADYYVVGGFVAPIEVWENFTPEWHRILKLRPRLGFYRTNDAIAFKGQFDSWETPARDERVRELARIIPSENCWGVAAHLSKRDFEEFFSPEFPEWDDPYYVCATYLIGKISFHLMQQASVRKADFIFDRQGKIGTRFKLVYDAKIRPLMISTFPFLGECRHENKEVFLPLQAADMNAAWVRRRMEPIQLWTVADPYLAQLEQLDFRVKREWLQKTAEYNSEHRAEIEAYWKG